MKNKKIQLWALEISRYNCHTEYIPRTQNTCANLLSRTPTDEHLQLSNEEELEVLDNLLSMMYCIIWPMPRKTPSYGFMCCSTTGLELSSKSMKTTDIWGLPKFFMRSGRSTTGPISTKNFKWLCERVTCANLELKLSVRVTDVPPFSIAQIGLDLSGPYPNI